MNHRPGDGDRLQRRHVGLVAMLLFVAVCEGFDVAVVNTVLPYAGKEFHADARTMGNALSVIGIGSIASWLLIRLADRFGRRPILIVTSIGFALGSLATMLASTIQLYTGIQTIARMLMVTQMTLAYLILAETLPPRLRGRINGVLGSFAAGGAALPFLLLGTAVTSAIGWRAMFLIGTAPLLAAPFLILWLRETPAYLDARAVALPRANPLAELRALLAPAFRRRFVGMSLLWFVINFSVGTGGLFFTLYVLQERHWTTGDLAWLAPGIMLGTLVGNLLAGVLMDLVGRRFAMSLFLLLGGLLAQTCYLATGWWAIATAWVGMQLTFGVWAMGFTVNAELFPTHLRAAGSGWCNSLIGRWGIVAAPAAIGALAHRLGSISPAVALLVGVGYLGIPLVWLTLPETRGVPLVAQPETV